MSSSSLVLGGGFLGGHLARALVADGDTVTVASRTPRPHPGLWRRFELTRPPWHQLFAPGQRVWITAHPGPRDNADPFWLESVPRCVSQAWKAGVSAVTVVAGAAAGDTPRRAMSGITAGPTTLVRVAPLFGTDGPVLTPLARSLGAKGVAKLPRAWPAAAWLHVDDAARAIVGLSGRGGALRLWGPERHDEASLSALLIERFGGRVGRSLLQRVAETDAAAVDGFHQGPDGWEEGMGERRTVKEWLGRLPGKVRR